MEITLIETVAYAKALDTLSKKHYKNFSIALKIARLKKFFAEQSDFYMQQERDIIDRYAEKSEDGNLKLSNGNVTFATMDDAKNFSIDLTKLKTTKVDINDPFKVVLDEDLADNQESLTPDEILSLCKIIDFELKGDTHEKN